MRRITIWLFSTFAGLVLLFSYRTSTMGAGGGAAVAAALPGTPGPATPGPATPTPADPTPAPSDPTRASADRTQAPADPAPAPAVTSRAASGSTQKASVAGPTVQTRWGPIQVTITVAGGKITDVAVPVYPNGNNRDEEINAYALPALREATLQAQSANIDTISGATVTSDGYLQSLQAALDSAHLG